ncbi:NADH-quinone oxidoreductase subunit A [Cytophagales bacterium LB-30]|uniref:NADH-quinone oxidoreductase subunit A n=1 Tax=Shiella aurantiaca TaxID=3058365 RepID=A0ABT8F2U3_9BACT|nr:NADH-quinone oxidoreductase subunit A [Shiella aurantiaca]MDN4164772.1 NADH-quinone oxidoreductase subunit A [Shiella aurantiaca]
MQVAIDPSLAQIALFILGGLGFVMISLLVARLIRPNRPNPEKLSIYESGEEPIGPAWMQFNARFYVVALIFLLFEVEILFLFPWALIFGDAEWQAATNGRWGYFALAEMSIFVLILAFGLAYVWAKGHLDWVKPNPTISAFKGVVPEGKYQSINQKYSQFKHGAS